MIPRELYGRLPLTQLVARMRAKTSTRCPVAPGWATSFARQTCRSIYNAGEFASWSQAPPVDRALDNSVQSSFRYYLRDIIYATHTQCRWNLHNCRFYSLPKGYRLDIASSAVNALSLQRLFMLLILSSRRRQGRDSYRFRSKSISRNLKCQKCAYPNIGRPRKDRP